MDFASADGDHCEILWEGGGRSVYTALWYKKDYYYRLNTSLEVFDFNNKILWERELPYMCYRSKLSPLLP